MPDEQEEGKRYIHRPIIQGRIALDKVTFHYLILQSISQGEPNHYGVKKVAIIKRISSGKRALERLIMGLYKPTEDMYVLMTPTWSNFTMSARAT